MPIYTFYPCRPDGSSTVFEAFELETDADVCEHAARLVEQHPSCSFVTVWQGDRRVLALPRPRDAAKAIDGWARPDYPR